MRTKKVVVKMSYPLAERCTPSDGDPAGCFRGPVTLDTGESEIEAAYYALEECGDFELCGTDDTFICIHKQDYEFVLRLLERLRDEHRKEDRRRYICGQQGVPGPKGVI